MGVSASGSGDVTAVMRLEGEKKLARALSQVAEGVQRRVLKTAGKAAGRMIATEMKRSARRLGTKGRVRVGDKTRAETRIEKLERQIEARYRLAETIEYKTKVYKRSGVFFVAIGPVYGAEYGYKGNIGHLVEKGHRMVLWGRQTGGRVPAYPFAKPAFDAKVNAAKQVIAVKVRAGLAREAAKARKR